MVNGDVNIMKTIVFDIELEEDISG